VKKHRNNSQYFKGNKLQSKIFNHLNIKKLKLTKMILEKKTNKKRKKGKKIKSAKKKKKRNALWITVVIHNDFDVGEQ